jgi:hypothetical protein
MPDASRKEKMLDAGCQMLDRLLGWIRLSIANLFRIYRPASASLSGTKYPLAINLFLAASLQHLASIVP